MSMLYIEFSRYSEVRLLSRKDKVPEVVEEVLKAWEWQTWEELKCVRTDHT